jgi:chromosome segregation ATPase
MSLTHHKKESEKSAELMTIWSKKSEIHSKKKALLKAQCDIETRIDDASKKKVELSRNIEQAFSRQKDVKEALDNTKKQEEMYSKQLLEIEQRIKGISGEFSSLEGKEKERLKELEDIKQKKADVETEKKDLLEKKNQVSSWFEELSKKKNALSEDVKKLSEEHDSLTQELAAIESEEQTSKDDITRIEDDMLKISEEIESLDVREKELISILEKDKNLPADFVEMLSTRLKISKKDKEDDLEEVAEEVGEESQTEGLTKEEITQGMQILEKRNEERIDDLKMSLRITDKLIVLLPMDHKKQFCSSRTFVEYEKLHKIVFDYQGTPIQKRYIRENVKWILREVDKLLGKLPEGEIDKFLASSDFEQYNRILESYGIVSK